jgi:outer membrane murein-binding lipoprotein Lpp
MTEAHPFRHRCSGCAYAAGLNEASKDVEDLVVQVKALTEENERLRAQLAGKAPSLS